jgi:transglutaminase/protease-like cytokinesis protein 3
MKRLFRLALGLLVITLSACSLIEGPFTPKITTRSAQSTVYGSRAFSIISQPVYVKEDTVYVVESEMELAMTAKLLFEEGVMMFYYEDRDLSLSQTYDYLDAIMIHAFKFSMGTKTYTQGETVIKALDYVKIELFNDQREVVDDHIDTFKATYLSEGDWRVQIREINKGLVLDTKYDTTYLDVDLSAITDHTSFEAYGLFEYDTAVCSGYAKAFLGVAEEVGIPALVVSSRAMNHAWNLVYDGQDWLYVDSTYNDPIPDKAGRVLTTYLLIDENTLVEGLGGNDGHVFDDGITNGLSAADYLAFAQFLFPNP